jgi:serine/threonine kinase 38
MKKMKKCDMLKKSQVQHILKEREFLAESVNLGIVKMKSAFQDEQHLYLVMEYLPGGDLMNLLIKKDILSEDDSRFYIGELVLAVDCVH